MTFDKFSFARADDGDISGLHKNNKYLILKFELPKSNKQIIRNKKRACVDDGVLILLVQMMEGIKRGILRGFLELDEKLRKIPEVIPLKL